YQFRAGRRQYAGPPRFSRDRSRLRCQSPQNGKAGLIPDQPQLDKPNGILLARIPFSVVRGCRPAQNFTRSRKRRLWGICCRELGDSSSMKYHFTPAFLAAFKIAGQSMMPVPSATSLVTSECPVNSPVGVPFFMSFTCINSKRCPYFPSSFTGSCPG